MTYGMPTATRSGLGTWERGTPAVIGANQAAVIFEIGDVEGAEAVVIVRAMRPREKFLR